MWWLTNPQFKNNFYETVQSISCVEIWWFIHELFSYFIPAESEARINRDAVCCCRRVPATLCTIINSATKESKCWDWIHLLRLFFVIHGRKWTVARFDRRTAYGSLADVTVEFFPEKWTKAVFLYNIWSQTCLGRPYNWKDLIVWWLNFLFTKK